MRSLVALAAVLAFSPCSRSDPLHPAASPEPQAHGIAFTAEDAELLKACIDQDPEQIMLLLEQVLVSGTASLTDEQFEEFRISLIEMLDEGWLEQMVRAGHEQPATIAEVAICPSSAQAMPASNERNDD